jgi:hypothetical protein
MMHENGEKKWKAEGGGGQLQIYFLLVDGISISNQMAKHQNAVSITCRAPNVASACNAGGSSSLHTRMKAAARLMQPLRCVATHLKTSQRFLQHTSNTQRRQEEAGEAPLCSHTCTFLTQPRVTRSIINPSQQCVVL